ncbi:MAG TPA: SLC13 family permease [Microbacteriaceae bacterium]|nr:SLC13 family permease [Microbacteriaceae bacterium]
MATPFAEATALMVLVAVLLFAVVRPGRLPEAVAAVPGAALLLLTGVAPAARAWREASGVTPTVVFLAAVLMLAQLCDAEGLFRAASAWMSRRAAGRASRLLTLVFVVVSLTTAVLSLDATVVLLTPVVFQTADRLGVRARPHLYATTHLANAASLALPVSNLTNLLALGAAGVGFVRFAGLMAGPWLVAIAVEYVVFRWRFRADLAVVARPHDEARTAAPMPVFAVVVLGLTLAGFAASSPLGLPPFWVALAAVVALLVKRAVRTPRGLAAQLARTARAAHVSFLVFVVALAVIVGSVVDHGLADGLRRLLPAGDGLVSLLVVAALAAVLANVVNNLPAVLVLLPLVAPAGLLQVLAVMIGVNLGPNLTYVGSLATLLWRRIAVGRGHAVELREFTRLGLLTVPAGLFFCTCALWLGARLWGA